MDVAPRGIDMAGKLQLEKQANCDSANMSTRRQASNLKREQANSSHCQHWHKTLASYGTLIFYQQEGSKPTAVMANLGARLWQAMRPYFF
jgi:hypothetical protein